MKTATFVRQVDGNGDGRVYRCEPPMSGFDYVWVSAVNALYTGPETYIFACDADGKVADWSEMDGSYRGGLNHEKALRSAGYEVLS